MYLCCFIIRFNGCYWILLKSTQCISRISNIGSIANVPGCTHVQKRNCSIVCLLSPQSQLYMHLTNYSVNKHNENFERDETVDKGSKRSVSWFTEFLRSNDYDVAKFWGDISVRWCSTETCMDPFVRFEFSFLTVLFWYLWYLNDYFFLFFYNHLK